jgi:hypothetical protein
MNRFTRLDPRLFASEGAGTREETRNNEGMAVMDASTLTKDVFEVVRPAIGAYGTAALTRDEDANAAKKVELGRAVLQEIYWRDKNVPPLETAVTDFAAGLQDEDAASGLRVQIRKVLEADEVLSAEVEKMLHGESAGINAEADAAAAADASKEHRA